VIPRCVAKLYSLHQPGRMATKHRLGSWYLNEKGYPRFCTGPYRNRYVHRVVMALHLKRDLKRDEDVHHRNGVKTDFRIRNLQVLGHREHGCVSALQHWYFKKMDIQAEKEFNEYIQESGQCPSGSAEQTSQAATA
jgi:hypothetical protein